MHLNLFLTDYKGRSAEILVKEYESIKSNLKHVLQSADFCGICLENERNLFHVREIMKLDLPTSCSMEIMMNDLFGEMIMNNIPSKYVCDHCIHNIRQTYHFINKVKTTSMILKSYLGQMESQIGEVETMLETTETNNFENIIIVLQNLITVVNEKDEESKITLDGERNLDDDSSIMDSDDEDSLDLETKYLHFKCKTCEEKFTTRLSYMQHCNELHPKGTTCLECKGQCIHKEYLEDIEKQIKGGNKLLTCLDCDFTCLKKQSLIGHINKDHLNYFPYSCESCPDTFHSLIAHQRHVASYHEETLKCKYCELKCTDSYHKIKHMAECKNQTKKFQCHECKGIFGTKHDIINHIESVHYNIPLLPCSICLREFTTNKLLKKHMQNAHKKRPKRNSIIKRSEADINRPRPCSVCPAILHSLSDLKRHLKSHEPGEKHNCHVCNKQFDTRKLYSVHVSSYTHQLKANPDLNTKFNFKCPHCDFTCKNNCMMENHKNTNHFKVKPHACTICNKAFTTSISLKYHMERHKGIRKFQCSKCIAMFTAASGLKKHDLRYHSDQRPVACDMCDKSFVCQSEYNIHKLRHHSEKNVPCVLCESKFHTLANLRAHLRKVHMKGKELDEFMKSDEASEQVYELMRDHRVLF